MENKIIFIIGPARSGTTFLANKLNLADTIYFNEPNHVWKHRLGYKKIEELSLKDVTDKARDYIRNYFFSKALRSGKEIILEKTPTNCLRLDYIYEIFPEAKFIFIKRKTDDIALSAYKKWTSEIDSNTKYIYSGNKNHKLRHFKEKFKLTLDIHPYDLLFYLPRAFSEIMFLLFGIKRKVWGPRYNNIFQDLELMSIKEVCLKQAKICQEKVEVFKSNIPDCRYAEVTFEDIIYKTKETTDELNNFIRQ